MKIIRWTKLELERKLVKQFRNRLKRSFEIHAENSSSLGAMTIKGDSTSDDGDVTEIVFKEVHLNEIK
jgi:hypothetical protein